jgi:hypothetical protein
MRNNTPEWTISRYLKLLVVAFGVLGMSVGCSEYKQAGPSEGEPKQAQETAEKTQ